MKIFLCYASEHRIVAERIALALQGEGHEVFFDKDTLSGGENVHAEIRGHIAASDAFVFLIAPESVEQGAYTLTELRIAREKWKHPRDHVLPVLAQATNLDDIPEYLKGVTIFEAEGDIAAELAAHFGEPKRWGLRRRLVLVAAGVLTIVASVLAGYEFLTPRTDASISEAVTLKPENFAKTYKVEDPELSRFAETFDVEINYPQLDGHPDDRIERKINESLKRSAGLYDDHKSELFDHVVTYEVNSLEYDLLSVSFVHQGTHVGAAGGNTRSLTLNINLKNGAPFELKDLFRSGYVPFVSKLVAEGKPCGRTDIEVYDDQEFFIKDGKLTVVYGRGEICARAAGVIPVEIELTELKPVVNPNGPLDFLR